MPPSWIEFITLLLPGSAYLRWALENESRAESSLFFFFNPSSLSLYLSASETNKKKLYKSEMKK